MNIPYLQVCLQEPFVFVEKISGLNTHQADPFHQGLAEYVEKQLGRKVYPCSRLDQGTSGALVFALNPQAAKELSDLFSTKQVFKRYIFLTDRKKDMPSQDFINISSFIEKKKNEFHSLPSSAPNAFTLFKKISSNQSLDIWEAQPLTGKSHQIRLHAQDIGIPICGDNDHGGSPFYRLGLHCAEVKFLYQNKEYSFKAQDPIWLNSEQILNWPQQEAILKREVLFGKPTFSSDLSFRLIHNEVPKLRADIFGNHLWVYWYGDEDPQTQDFEKIEQLAVKLKKKVWIRKMINRGKDPNTENLWPLLNPDSRWVARENHFQFELRSDTGQSPGLFLDQRENRRWVYQHAKDSSVLNLFSYTAGFSVVAALGQAKTVCSVDVSANFNDWAKYNFQLNQLNPNDFEFWNQDSILFLKACIKRKRDFDLIICDPPSFARNRNQVFSIEKNLSELLDLCSQCLSPKGKILFSTNYEKWTTKDLLKKIQLQFPQRKISVPTLPGLDFDLPSTQILMKSFLIEN